MTVHRMSEEVRRLGAIWVLGALCTLGNAAVPCPVDAQCVADTVGVPVTLANGVDFNSFGSASGESFYASDTLIESITIWRPANYTVAIGLNLFITKAYLTQPILFDCGVVRVYDSNPPGLPIPMTWTFSPPLSLPFKGLFVLWLQDEECNVFDFPILCH